MKSCPYCAEEIQDEAVYCRYCRRSLRKEYIPNSVRKLFFPLIILVGFIVLLVYSLSIYRPQSEIDARATAVAMNMYTSQTAAVPTSTPTKRATPTKTATPTATPSRTSTPTPAATSTPDAIALGGINLREGPGTNYDISGRISKSEELDILGQYENCSWLKVKSRSQSLEGWISFIKGYIDTQIECGTVPIGTFRPPTGVIKPNQSGGGYGVLEIDNGTAKDALVVLTYADKPVFAAYIRSGDTFDVRNLRDRNYYLYFSTGDDWNGEKFLSSRSLKKFEAPLSYATWSTTSSTTITTNYMVWSVSLQVSPYGTASVSEISDSAFPDFED